MTYPAHLKAMDFAGSDLSAGSRVKDFIETTLENRLFYARCPNEKRLQSFSLRPFFRLVLRTCDPRCSALCGSRNRGKKKLIAPFEVQVAVDGSDTHPGTAERSVAKPEKARRRERFAW
ncbi:MAG: hypothetical protein AB8D78_00505 [Akkermansiaceae bacterium]